MTTIAYRAGVMAGDGRETWCEDRETSMVSRDDCVKVFVLPDGRLYGGARTSENITTLQEALTKSTPENPWPCPPLDDINALCIALDGTIWVYEGTRWTKEDGDYAAVGSGSRFALPALDAGADAVRAVEIGIKRDPYSGGKITVIKLKP